MSGVSFLGRALIDGLLSIDPALLLALLAMPSQVTARAAPSNARMVQYSSMASVVVSLDATPTRTAFLKPEALHHTATFLLMAMHASLGRPTLLALQRVLLVDTALTWLVTTMVVPLVSSA